MLKLIIALGALAAGGYFLPQVYEGTGNACAALETKLVGRVNDADRDAGAALQLAAGFSNGQVGRRIAQDQYPNLPGGLACVVGWYNLNPDEMRF